jgi:hypothetical protein
MPDPEYDVLQHPFIFRTQTDRGAVAVCEVEGHIHLAVGEMAVPLPVDTMDALAKEWCKARGLDLQEQTP